MTDAQEDRRPCALVVDDDELLRMDVREILERAGFRTLDAEDGDAAILMLEERHLDVPLMLSDVETPGTRDGLALARGVAGEAASRRDRGRLRPHLPGIG